MHNFHYANFIHLYGDILNTSWENLFSQTNANKAWQLFYDNLEQLFSAHVRKTIPKCNGKYPPWFHGGITRKLKLKSHIHTLYKHPCNSKI